MSARTVSAGELDRQQPDLRAVVAEDVGERRRDDRRKPASSSAHTACSRLEPLPKFGPASRIVAPANSGRFSTKSGSLRHSANRNGPNPVRSIRLRYSAGTIWSVSTSARSSGSARPVCVGERLHAYRSSGVREVAGDRGRGRDGRADEVRAAAPALTSLEVPVARRGAALAGRELVRVHAEAHRAAGVPPLEPGGLEDRVEALAFGLALHEHRAGARPSRAGPRAPSARPGCSAASRRSSIREFVHEPMKTVSGRMSRIGVPGVQVHVRERALGGLVRGLGDDVVDRDGLAGVRPPGDVRARLDGLDAYLLVEGRTVVGRSDRQSSSARSQSAPLGACGATLEVRERRVVGGDQAGAGARLDRHVADRHPSLHRERRGSPTPGTRRRDRRPPSVPILRDDPQDHVLGRDAGRQRRPRRSPPSCAGCVAAASASRGRARPRSCRCRTRAPRTRRACSCASRRTRSSARAA